MAEAKNVQKLVVRGYALSLDGFSSAAGQSLESPFGTGGLAIMDWAFQTRIDFTVSPLASKLPCNKLLQPRRARTCAWAAARCYGAFCISSEAW